MSLPPDDHEIRESMKTPWQKARERQSLRQERKLGKSIHGRQQINSGRTAWFSKRDAKQFQFLIEARTTENPQTRSICIKKDELKKIRQDAIFSNSLPAMQIEFPFDHESWTLMETRVFIEQQERILDLEARLAAEMRKPQEFE